MTLKRILTDPKAVLAAVAGGFAIGLFAKPLGAALYPVGSLYIAFLSMCLLPILITAIVIGIAGLLRDDNTRPLFKPMAGLYRALAWSCPASWASSAPSRSHPALGSAPTPNKASAP